MQYTSKALLKLAPLPGGGLHQLLSLDFLPQSRDTLKAHPHLQSRRGTNASDSAPPSAQSFPSYSLAGIILITIK